MGPLEVWVIVVAGGSGARFGAEKQFVLLADRPVVAWSVLSARRAVGAWAGPRGSGAPTDGARSTGDADPDQVCGGGSEPGAKGNGPGAIGERGAGSHGAGGVVLVVPPHRVEEGSLDADVVVAGGTSRSASVRAGLAVIPASAEVIVVHDAARPLATSALFTAVVSAVLHGADAAVPGLEVTDTIRRRGGGVVDRSDLLRVQTPQAFRARALFEAHRQPVDATDDATLVEQAGGTVTVVPGESTNIKLTDPTDLAVAEVLWRLLPALAPAGPGGGPAALPWQTPDAAPAGRSAAPIRPGP